MELTFSGNSSSQGYNLLTTPTEVEAADADNNATLNTDGTEYVSGGVQVINSPVQSFHPPVASVQQSSTQQVSKVMAGAVFFVVRSRKHD